MGTERLIILNHPFCMGTTNSLMYNSEAILESTLYIDNALSYQLSENHTTNGDRTAEMSRCPVIWTIDRCDFL